jgi:hypothetical protein
MGALGYVPRAHILVCWDVDASLAFHGNVKTEALSIDFHPQKLETLPSSAKIIRFS